MMTTNFESQLNCQSITTKSQMRGPAVPFRTCLAGWLIVACWMSNLSANAVAKMGRLPGNPTARNLTFMNGVPPTVERKHQRIEVKIPVVANGVDRNGQLFTEPTQTVNGSLGGMALLLEHEPSPSSSLLISIVRKQHHLHLQTEVCHVTQWEDKKIVGVKFR